MKRIVGFLVFVLLLVALSMPAYAAEKAQITLAPDKTTVNRGDTVKITVSISGDALCTSVGFFLKYNANAFVMVDGGVTAEGTLVNDFNDGGIALVYKEATRAKGRIGYFVLKAKKDANLSSYSLSGNATVKNASTTITSSVKATSISIVCKHTFNSWSKVNNSEHTRRCSTCGLVETKAHTFDHGCDTTCNNCSYTRTTAHKYGTEWSGDAEYHFYACVHCGDRKDAVAHTPGDPATEEAAQICTVCQLVIVEKLEHVHELTPEYATDETSHWYDCIKCGEKVDFGEHVYLHDCDALCDVCGYARETEVEHTPSEEWASDEVGHWHPCTVCQEKVEEALHSGDLNVVEPKCDVCEHAMPHEHLYEEKWHSNVMEHYHECVCGERAEVQAHTWDEGVVTEEPYREKQGTMTYTCTVCGEQDTAIIIETSRDLKPWWIACGALSIVVLVMAIVLIVIVVKANKKATGKYAVK